MKYERDRFGSYVIETVRTYRGPGLIELRFVVGGAVVAAVAARLGSLSLIDAVVLLGIAVVLPLALGGELWRWHAAAASTLAAFLLPTGWAGLVVLPLVAVVAAHLVATCGQAGPLMFWRTADTLRALAALFALVAAGALAFSRAGLTLLGIEEPIVELTSVHYIYAGAGALMLAAHVLDGGRVARAAVVLTAAAPPIVATGFFTRSAIAQVGGAVLMTLGVWLTAGLQLRTAGRAGSRPATVLLAISGLAVWVPMVLAVAWASGQHWAVPALSIPDMARTHGVGNALGFVMCGLAGRHIEAAARLRSPATVGA